MQTVATADARTVTGDRFDGLLDFRTRRTTGDPRQEAPRTAALCQRTLRQNRQTTRRQR